jgi:chaperonin GroEL
LVNLSEYINALTDNTSEEARIADKIISDALLYPIKQICSNAGYSGDVAVDKITKNKSNNYGFNAKTGEY